MIHHGFPHLYFGLPQHAGERWAAAQASYHSVLVVTGVGLIVLAPGKRPIERVSIALAHPLPFENRESI
jgi:hypothetical protein